MTTKLIHEANLAEVKELSKTSAAFVIKPLYYGYGNTLGNSLRRVLLSSIKGAAITSFSVEGATHEFTTIKGVREDIVDIMLNLKNIRFKSHTDNPVELELSIKGKDQSTKDGDPRVIAGDIKLPSEVEIANPNQTICHIDDPNVLDAIMNAAYKRKQELVGKAAETKLHDASKNFRDSLVPDATNSGSDVYDKVFENKLARKGIDIEGKEPGE